MAILDNYASDFVGPSALPRPRTVFTPAAFAQATSIADRARLASSNLKQSLSLADSESKMRDYILKGQEQDEQSAKLYQDAQLRAMQPALKQELGDIDPADDDAFDKLTDMEQYTLSPDLRRRVSSLKSSAGIVRREKLSLIDSLKQAGADLPTIESKLKEADATFKNGDSLAYSKASVGLRSYNETEAMKRLAQRPRYEAETAHKEAVKGLSEMGLGTDPAKAEMSLKTKLKAMAPKLKWLNPDKFMEDPDLALLEAPPEESSGMAVDTLKSLGRAVIKLKSAKDAQAQWNRIRVAEEEAKRTTAPNNAVAGMTEASYIANLLQPTKPPATTNVGAP